MRFRKGRVLLSGLTFLLAAGQAPAQTAGPNARTSPKPTPSAADIITGPVAGGWPHVKAFDGKTSAIKSPRDAATGHASGERPRKAAGATNPANPRVRDWREEAAGPSGVSDPKPTPAALLPAVQSARESSRRSAIVTPTPPK